MFSIAIFFGLVANILVTTGKSLPSHVIGYYCLLADDTITNYTSSDTWQPSLYDYQQVGSNLLLFSFINPKTMSVPSSFSNLSKCKGQQNCPTNSQYILYSIGGYGYSSSTDYWPWLQNSTQAIAMANNVSNWDTLYNIDGIDISLGTPAGQSSTISDNLLVFVKQLKTANPNLIITIPTYGYPQILAIDNLINNCYNPKNSTYYGLIDGIEVMVYSNLTSLQYADYYVNPAKHYVDTIITVNVTKQALITGIQGNADNITILNMSSAIVHRNLKGMIVWFASVYDKTRNKAAFSYGENDASSSIYKGAWKTALSMMLNETTQTNQSSTSTTPASTSSSTSVSISPSTSASTSTSTSISTSSTSILISNLSTTASSSSFVFINIYYLSILFFIVLIIN